MATTTTRAMSLRAYQVGFGDCFLLSFEYGRGERHLLIDFGSTRQRATANRSQKVALTPGYAALEQYPGHGDLGPGADVYSISATLYRCITGQEPVDAR